MKKRLICLMLSLMMVITLLPTSALADELKNDPTQVTDQGEPQADPAPAADPGPSAGGWERGPDGFLRDPGRRLLALPCDLRGRKPGLRLESIDGREYLLFRY